MSLNGQREVLKGYVSFQFALAWTCFILSAASLIGAETFANQDCLDCHTDPTTSRVVAGKSESLPIFPTNLFAASVHAKLNCVDCHNGVKELVHDTLPPAQCSTCHDASHEKAVQDYAASIHGVSHKLGESAAASCADCHGSHAIVRVKDPSSPAFKLNLPRTCAKCHSNAKIMQDYRVNAPDAAAQYKDSIHGRALMELGLIVAPSCNDCHGVHDIKRSVDSKSPVNRNNVAATCGRCHVKVEEIYDKSVHGQLLAKGDSRAPVCTDCHTAHQIAVRNNHFKQTSDERCGKCHQDRLTHYRETYHGKAMALGRVNDAPEVAACYDCHGAHNVLPVTNSASLLSKQNIVSTCRKCHSEANASFVGYAPHADPQDGQHYPGLHRAFVFMTALLAGVFAVFGAHTLLWLTRSTRLLWHDSKTFRENKTTAQTDGETFTRFAPFERFLHFLVVTSFLLLVITGMPLKFYDSHWAKVMFDVIGGVQVARALHHFGALVTFLYFSLHLISLTKRSWRGRERLRDPQTGRISVARAWNVLFGPDSMIPNLQDARDVMAHVKYFLHKGPRPQFDRWTYWEKFDYFAVFWGVAIIGFSGLVLWFPQLFSRLLPGWFINIAQVVHSDEALLAAGFIFTVHFFNTHFRFERFPMDTAIFSGRISKSEMLHERKRWYDRLATEGRLEQTAARDEWPRWRALARTFGFSAVGIGLVLLAFIIAAMVTRLLQ